MLDGGPFSLTADYFRIRLADRLALTQLFALTAPEVEGLLAEGVTSARNLQNFRFFTNHFETLTRGLDLVATYAPPSLGGRTTLGLLFNHTATTVTRFDPAVLDALRVRELQEAIPGTRWNASVRHEVGRWRLLGRFSYYGEWFDSRDLYAYRGDSVVDLEAAYPVSDSTTLTVGGQNAFGNDPEENPIALAKPRGANAGAITGLLAGSCCGWGRKPSAAEFHDAVRETEPTPRQRAIINVLITEASNDTIALAYLQGAFTWRQLATAMRRHGNYSPRLARYVNLHADASHEAT